MRHVKEYRRGCTVKAIFFFALLAVLFVSSLILPLRPTESQLEGRELTEFPEFSAASLLNGEYFRGIDDWFSDTFPGRDSFLDLNRKLRELYGIRTVEIVGTIGTGDEIPDTPFTGN